MVPKVNRLRGEKNFRRLMTRGQVCYTPLFSLRYVKNNLTASRFAFVVSTRVDKRATIRNKIQRRMREVVRHALPTIESGYDILIAAKKPALEVGYQRIREEIFATLLKPRLIKNT